MCQLIHCIPLSMTQIVQISSRMVVQIHNIGFGSSSSRGQKLTEVTHFRRFWKFPGLSHELLRKIMQASQTGKSAMLPAVRSIAAVQQ